MNGEGYQPKPPPGSGTLPRRPPQGGSGLTRAESVHHPAHYHPGAHEVIDVIEAWGLGFCLGNVVKYVARHAVKGSALEDLKKARWYLDRAIAQWEREQ